MFRVGDPIRIAGFRGRRNPTGIFATNILLADGREVFNESFAEQRWTENLAGTTMSSLQAAVTQELQTEPRSIFRVWSTVAPVFDGSGRNLDRVLWNDSYPLTANARETQARWDPVDDNPYIHCLNGMPAIMDQIHPMEFRENGGDVVLHLEEQDIVRRIHMSDEPQRSEQSSPFGYSVGRWDGETLVVTTTDIDWPWFDQAGVPQSTALELVERFRPSTDGRVLRYAVTATDPAVFTEPVTLQRTWIWVPGEEIKPYNCSWEGDSL
jgi:hypothetical protein